MKARTSTPHIRCEHVPLEDLRANGKYTLVGGPFGSDLTSNDYVDRPGVPVIRGTNLGGNDSRFVDDGFVYVSEDKAESLRRNLAYPGDLVFTQRGTLGQVGVIPHDCRFPEYVISQSQMKLTPDTSRVDARYLYRYFRSPAALSNLLSRRQATGVPHINLGILKELVVPLPPLPEQRRIAAILDQADGVRRKRQTALSLTDQFLRSTFLEMFGDPVRNPKGWEVVRLDEIASVNRGKFTPRPRNDPRYYGGCYPFIQTGDLSRTTGVLREWKQTLNDEGIKVSRQFPTGTIAISIAANIGDTAILGFDAYLTDSVVGIEVRHERAAAEYVEFWLRFQQQSLKDNAPETAQKNINLEVLRPLRVMLPAIDMQRRFAEIVHNIDRSVARLSKGAGAINHLFDSLVHHAFRGEL